LNESTPPQFIKSMRSLNIGEDVQFFIERANYYDAVGYDDSVFSVYQCLLQDNNHKSYKLVIVDEYQDFNLLEVSLLKLISQKSPILITGDDDQALYLYLRNSDPKHIRDLFYDEDYEKFELPYCTRCTEVIVNAFNDVVETAKSCSKLSERIDKPFNYLPPLKKSDSEKYPKIKLIRTTIQNKKSKSSNYFGRYISNEICKIEKEEIKESKEKGFTTVLIIGSIQYLRQVHEYLTFQSHDCNDIKKDTDNLKLDLEDGMKILKNNKESNLGWRVVLEISKPNFFEKVIKETKDLRKNLINIIPEDFKEKILKELEDFQVTKGVQHISDISEVEGALNPKIILTSFEGAKGLSAQHVFIIGVQDGDLPRNNNNPTDFEINKFLVALTRTRKQCHILYTTNFSGKIKKPSVFLNWIKDERLEKVKVDKKYWNRSNKFEGFVYQSDVSQILIQKS